MSWNIKTPGDYINGPLTVAGNVGIGTTTFTSIAGYTSLKINNATNGAILDLAQGDAYKGRVIGSLNGLILESAVGLPVQIQVGGLNSFKADPAGVYTWYDGAGGVNQRMQLNSTGLGIGAAPGVKLDVVGTIRSKSAAGDTSGLSIWSDASSNGNIFQYYNGPLIFGTNNTERARINSTGAFVFVGGTANANGIGIAFPSAQSASTDANTLDDYEEGTWTPTITYETPGTLSVSYASQSGTYTKIGNIVTLSFGIRLSAFTKGTASGNLRIGGVPFAQNFDSAVGTVGTYLAPLSSQPIIIPGATSFNLQRLINNGAWVSLDDPDSDSQYFGSITIKV